MPEKSNSANEGITQALDLKDIDPSPYQHRRHFDEDKLRELAVSIQREGLIEPIVVRSVGKRYELIARERRFRAIRDFTEMETIQAQIVIAGDLQARRISAAENLQREDLSAIETIEGNVEMVDAELIEDKEYASMGKKPADRVKVLLGKLHSITNSKDRGSKVSKENEALLNKFVQQVEKIFKNLPKSLEWRSFFNHDLNLIVETGQEVRDVAIRHKLSKSQARALQKLSRASKSRFDSFIEESGISGKNKDRSDKPSPSKRGLKEFSAAEIEAIAEKEIEKQALAEQERLRETIPLVSKVKALLMSRLGIPVEIIASNLRINWKTVTKYCNNLKLFQSIRDSLDKGLSASEAAQKHACPACPVAPADGTGVGPEDLTGAYFTGVYPVKFLSSETMSFVLFHRDRRTAKRISPG